MDVTSSFKLYDVRGYYPSQVDERLAYLIGRALTFQFQPKKILLAMDQRPSSPKLLRFLSDGLNSKGSKLFNLSQCPISQFYFAMATSDFDLGIMITASHITEDENGFKFSLAGALPLDENQIENLKKNVLENKKETIVVPPAKTVSFNNLTNYCAKIIESFQGIDFLPSVVIDTSGSSAKTAAIKIYRSLKVKFSQIENGPTGSPLLPENQKEIKRAVVERKADIGIKFDSDGDRVIFIGPDGQQIPMSFVLGLLAASEVQKTGRKKVAVDVRAGLVVRDLVEKVGGRLVTLPAWSQYLKFAMREDPEIGFAGETSGHFIFERFFKIDDGIMASLAFLQLSQAPTFSDQLRNLSHRYFELPERNFPCPEERSSLVLEKITQYYRSCNFPVSVEDGLTVFGSNWKFNLRQSLTEPLLRLNLEARDEEESSRIIDKLESFLEP